MHKVNTILYIIILITYSKSDFFSYANSLIIHCKVRVGNYGPSWPRILLDRRGPRGGQPPVPGSTNVEPVHGAYLAAKAELSWQQTSTRCAGPDFMNACSALPRIPCQQATNERGWSSSRSSCSQHVGCAVSTGE